MSTDGDKATVFRTTKVRTKLRGDNSWLQQCSEPQPETDAEKPWIAEVRASRLNEANIESSPVSTTTQSSPTPVKTSTERSPTSGFMIRGVFTKTEKTPTTSNGYSGTTQFTKKPSETYKKIAPHIVRNTENQESQLSQEEQEKRTEAASNVLKKTAAKQRSYVLSAAKLYESKDKTPDLLVNSTTSFVAQRVEVAEDEDSNSSSPTTTTTTVTNVTPQPKPRTIANTSLTKEETKPVEVKIEDKDPFENMVPGCTKVATPLPELIPDLVQAVYVKSDDSADAEQPESPVVEPAPKTPAPATPPPQAVTTESIVIVTEAAVKAEPEPDDIGPVEISSDSIPVCYPDTTPERFKEEEPLQLVEVEPQKSPEVEEDPKVEVDIDVSPEPQPQTEPEQDLVQFKQTEIIVQEEKPEEPVEEVEVQKEAEPETQTEVKDEVQKLIEIEHIKISLKEEEPVPSVEEKEDNSIPPVNNVEPLTDDLLGFNDSSPQLVQLVSPNTGPWSQDLLTPVESEKPEPEKTGNIVDLLSNEDIVLTQVHSLSVPPDVEEEKPPATEAQSVTETVTITTQTVIITDESEAESADPLSSHVITTTVTESSSTDPFDPYPIGTTSSNRSSDLLQPLADLPINSASGTSGENKETGTETRMSSTVLESLSDDIIPFNTKTTTSFSTDRSWARTWEAPLPESTEESQKAAAAEEGQDGDQQTVIMFERKSKENDSPWDRWTSPTVYTIDKEDDEEEEPAKLQETETEVITTVTTIRETYSEPKPSMESILTEQEPDSKKPFVYVKEYVNSSELSLLNARDTDRSDYLTSTSSTYSYSSPTTYIRGSLSSKCTFCGELVGSDAKITIEHLNVNCHPECFKCDKCFKPMGDFLHKMFMHGGKVYCEICYRDI